MVTPDRWQQVKAVLEDALERQGAEREAFLADACQGDDELRREVESLLASEDEIGDFIETPVFRIRPEDAEPVAAGQRIGAYRIVREIGRGGMGSVYLAERADEEFEHRVALKLVRRGMDTDEILSRFRSERQILAHLDHPNIAKLFDGGSTEDGRPYFVMEYVEGRPIDEYCKERKLTTRERLELFRSVCSAVHFAHQNLIVHRDLKPGNILVTAGCVPKLLDFGIAKLLNPDQEGLTQMDVRPMTPEYASPEQVRGEAITTASDIYSLGVLLYVLLTGLSPYRPATREPQDLAKAICETEPLRPSSAVGKAGRVRDGEEKTLRRHLAGDLDNIVLMAMQKEPKRRYASVDQLSNDISRHLQGLPVIARKDSLRYRAGKFVARHKLGVSVAALFLLLIVGFSTSVTALWRQAIRERQIAVLERQKAQTVSDFLIKVFTSSNPGEARGDEITARELLESGEKKINESLVDQPELRAEMKQTIGRVYRSLGFFEPAKRLLEESLGLYRETLPEDDPRIANNLHNLANVYRDLDDDDTAERLIREALEIQRRSGNTQNLDYASGLANLGAYLVKREKLDEAEALLKESLAIKKTLPDIEPAEMADSLNNLGMLSQTHGNYEAAERYLQEALEIRRRLAGGRPDPKVITTINNLASLWEDQGKLAAAEDLYRESLEMRLQLYKDGPNARVARGYNALGHVRQSREDVSGAENLYRKALEIADQTLPADHSDRAIYLRNLGSALLAQGKMTEAESKIREALTIFRQEPESWRVADAGSVLGSCLAAQGRFQEAEPLLVNSYTRLKKDDGDGAKQADAARQRIVELYMAWGRPEKAAAYRKNP
ncbi:MAG TPA: serine/threonine-protein kinase [Thermoanaerobaculia bacterium]